MTAGEAVLAWWRALVPDDEGTKASKGHQRAALARLRRARDAIDVMMEPEALRLIQRLPRPHHRPERVATVAGVLAFVTANDASHIIRSVGRTTLEDESAPLSENRFRRLMQLSRDDLLDPMRRLVRLNKGHANVHDLAESILFWGDSVKKRWIFEYYGVERVVEPGPTAAASDSPPSSQSPGEPT